MFIAFYSIIALLFGSFTNVLIHRSVQNQSILSPGSYCPSCKTKIKWYNNIPLLSYIFLAGKCPDCKSKISIRYPLVELLVPLLSLKFILEASKTTQVINHYSTSIQQNLFTNGLNFLDFLFSVTLISIVVALAVVDLKHHLLPHSLTYSGILIGIIFITIFGTQYYPVPDYFLNILDGYPSAFISSLMQIGITFFCLDFFTHFANRIYYRNNGLEIASSALTFRIPILEKAVSIIYLFIFIAVISLMASFQDIWVHYIFVALGASYLINEIIIDYFFSKPDLENHDLQDKKTVLGGGDVAMIAMISVIFGIAKTTLVTISAFYILFVFIMFRFIVVFFQNAFDKGSGDQVDGKELLKENLARHIPLGGALAVSFIAGMMFFNG